MQSKDKAAEDHPAAEDTAADDTAASIHVYKFKEPQKALILYPSFDETVSYAKDDFDDGKMKYLSRPELQELAKEYNVKATQTNVKILADLRALVEEDTMEEEEEKGPHFLRLGKVAFPPPSGLNVNMMPFIFGDRTSLPPELQAYYGLTQLCYIKNPKLVPLCPDGDPEILNPTRWMKVTSDNPTGTVCYLSVQESDVEPDACQRRAGAHTEGGASISCDPQMDVEAGGALDKSTYVEKKSRTQTYGYGAEYDSEWGGGKQIDGCLFGGIYLASTVASSTRVWNARVDDTKLIGPLGDMGHLTDRFGEHTDLVEREFCWLTDRTPHMALPVVHPTHRQFFRLVTKGVNVWYAKHSTPNPLGIVPPESVRIIEVDKFAAGGGSGAEAASLQLEAT